MKITKRSTLSGVVHTRDIKITAEQLEQFNAGRHIQWVCPNLSPDDREFLLSGSTPEEWDAMCAELDEDDIDDQEVQ